MKMMTRILAALLTICLAVCSRGQQKENEVQNTAITVNLRYTGTDGNARKFPEEMTASGTVRAIRAEEGNLRYEYFFCIFAA